jgi:membrane protein implicated in regulation of membrane protease activity
LKRESEPRPTRFGAYSIAFFVVLLAMGLAAVATGLARVSSNEGGGSTLVVGGMLLLLVDVVVFVGLASTRVSRVEKKYHRMEAMVGEEGVVKEGIRPYGRGVVLLRHELWSATSEEELAPGTRVRIVKIDGLLLFVEGIK